MDRPLFLVGMMGAGKTTVGRLLAKQLAVPFRDTDLDIAQAKGMPVAAIFAKEGEAVFRALEADWVMNLLPVPVVIATGGGLPIYGNNMSKLLTLGTVIYLEVNAISAQKRLANKSAERPLWRNKASWQQLLEARELIYSAAHYTVNTIGKTELAVAHEIEKIIYVK